MKRLRDSQGKGPMGDLPSRTRQRPSNTGRGLAQRQFRGDAVSRLARVALIVPVVCLAVTLAACSSPAKPSVSVASGHPVSPTTGAQFSYYSQPVTLVIASGVASEGASITTLEVATDAAFTSVTLAQVVSPNATGQLAVTLDHLMPATTYYWRVRTAAGDNPGIFSPPVSFSIGPLLVIQSPMPVQPLANTFPHRRPTFIVTDATRSGPPSTLTYRFDVATDAAFSNVVTSGTVPEAAEQTSFVPTVDLIPGATYYWRAQASDTTKGVTGGYSSPQPFTTVFPDDGIYRYTFVVNVSPTGCRAPWIFDNALSVNGNSLRFNAPGYDGSPGMTVNLQRNANQLSGILSGAATYQGLPSVEVFSGSDYSNLSSPAKTAGSGDNAGRFAGRFNGIAYFSTIGLAYGYCLHATIDWTLTPH
jgi:hypothetical protein